MKKVFTLLLSLLIVISLSAQMPSNGQILYGNEWIDYDKSYAKVKLSADGFYRVNYETLLTAGWDSNDLVGSAFKLFYMGEEIAINVSTQGVFSSSDYIEFYGFGNDGKLDRFLYNDWQLDQLNPAYSFFTDESAYYIGLYPGENNRRYDEINNDIINNLPVKEEFYMHEEKLVYSDFHYKPTYNGGDLIRYSNFHTAEGYGSNLRTTNNINLITTNLVNIGQDATISVRAGFNNVTHSVEISLNGNIIGSEAFTGAFTKEYAIDVSVNDLNNNNNISVKGTQSNTDRNMISVASISYPRAFDFGGESNYTFSMSGSPFDRYIEIENFDQSSTSYLYNLTSGYKMSPVVEGAILKFRIPAHAEVQKYILTNTDSHHSTIETAVSKTFIDYSLENPEYIILTSEKLNNAEGGANPIEAYANHRASDLGGGYTTYAVNVEELYDQFSYGVERHPLSIRNFAHYVKNQWSRAEYMVVIGKAREYTSIRTPDQLASEENIDFMVPTLGVPGSDNLLFGSQGPGQFLPLYKVGRIPINNKQEVRDYLEKIIAYDNIAVANQTIEDKLWRKRVMHLAGGGAEGEQNFIKSRLGDMGTSLENNKYGANVITYIKTSSDPIQTNVSQTIIDDINKGVGIITFFGHSAVGTFDFSIENPEEYDNNFKNPVMFSLGCHSGNIHTESQGISESFVIIPEKGAVAFIASSSTAYISPQANFGSQFYDLLGGDLYGKSIGEILNTILLSHLGSTSISIETLMQQLTLNGDPAIIMQDYPGPDYLIDSESLAVAPDIISTNSDNFDLIFDVINLGSHIDTTIQVRIKHKNSDGELLLDTLVINEAPEFSTTFTVSMPTPGIEGLGKNRVEIYADPNNVIEELPGPDAEQNNKLIASAEEDDYCFFVLDAGIKPIWPTQFDIVNDDCPYILKAATDNIFVEQQNYIFEIDTTELFDSPSKESGIVNSPGGLIEWTPSATPINNQVYYWRVRPEEDNEGKILWANSSFVYIANANNGWNQSHFYQYQKNSFDGLDYKDHELRFDTSGHNVTLRNAIWDGNFGPDAGYFFNLDKKAGSVRPWNFMPNGGIAILVADSISATIKINNGGDYGSITSSNFGSFRTFGFETDTPEKRKLIIDMLEQHITNNEYVFFFTVLTNQNVDIKAEEWAADQNIFGKSIFSVLEEQGAAFARDLGDLGTVPYNFIYRKGVEKMSEAIGEDINSKILTSTFFAPPGIEGVLETVLIGPASSWDKVVWNNQSINSEDTIHLSVIAIDGAGNEISLYNETKETELDLSMANELSTKYIKLKYYAKDEVFRTPPQINYLRVFYTGIPDGTINLTNNDYTFNSDTLSQGENLQVALPIYNYTSESLAPSYMEVAIVGSNNSEIKDTIDIPRIDPKSSFIASYSYSTLDLAGEYQFRAEYNPEENPTEEYYFNNFGLRSFFVESDNINPVLDVRFDGVSIIDGDLVSAQPEITISVKDENDYLLVDDPELFELALEFPNGTIENIPSGDSRLSFIPAETNSEENKATLIFNPSLVEDGIYKLYTQAKDKSGNFSGNNNYEVSFEVITKKAISNVLNYPNPFSTSTQFVFTVTGSVVPSSMMINIYTVSGKLVRQIRQDELGAIKVGVNRTNYKWDGTDEYGNRLANGVYLYKVEYGEDIQDFEQLFNNTESYFDNGFGKMVIMR